MIVLKVNHITTQLSLLWRMSSCGTWYCILHLWYSKKIVPLWYMVLSYICGIARRMSSCGTWYLSSVVQQDECLAVEHDIFHLWYSKKIVQLWYMISYICGTRRLSRCGTWYFLTSVVQEECPAMVHDILHLWTGCHHLHKETSGFMNKKKQLLVCWQCMIVV